MAWAIASTFAKKIWNVDIGASVADAALAFVKSRRERLIGNLALGLLSLVVLVQWGACSSIVVDTTGVTSDGTVRIVANDTELGSGAGGEEIRRLVWTSPLGRDVSIETEGFPRIDASVGIVMPNKVALAARLREYPTVYVLMPLTVRPHLRGADIIVERADHAPVRLEANIDRLAIRIGPHRAIADQRLIDVAEASNEWPDVALAPLRDKALGWWKNSLTFDEVIRANETLTIRVVAHPTPDTNIDVARGDVTLDRDAVFLTRIP